MFNHSNKAMLSCDVVYYVMQDTIQVKAVVKSRTFMWCWLSFFFFKVEIRF